MWFFGQFCIHCEAVLGMGVRCSCGKGDGLVVGGQCRGFRTGHWRIREGYVEIVGSTLADAFS